MMKLLVQVGMKNENEGKAFISQLNRTDSKFQFISVKEFKDDHYLNIHLHTNDEPELLTPVTHNSKTLNVFLNKKLVMVGPWFSPNATTILDENYKLIRTSSNGTYPIITQLNEMVIIIIRELEHALLNLEDSNYVYYLDRDIFRKKHILAKPTNQYREKLHEQISYKKVKGSHRPFNRYNSLLEKFIIFAYNSDLQLIKSNGQYLCVNVKTKVAGAGKGVHSEENKRSACFEYLERWAGSLVPDEVKESTYINIKEQAIHPRKLGVYEHTTYNKESKQLQQYTDTLQLQWVKAFSYKEKREKYVPLQVVNYLAPAKNRYIFENSNGCAMGNSMEEATLYGLLELIERDSFLAVWYKQLQVPEIDRESIESLDIQLVIKKMELDGYELRLFNTTLDTNIPSVWVVALGNTRSQLATFSTAGAHVSVEKAIYDAVMELYHSYKGVEDAYNKEKLKISTLVKDEDVLDMESHAHFYAKREQLKRFDFLLNRSSVKKMTVQEMKKKYDFRSDDIREDLRYVLHSLERLKYEVIVYNQTPKELEYLNLYVVKCIVPELLTLDFGYPFSRVRRKRLEEVSQLHIPTKLKEDEVSSYIHPFP
ncbi:MULTISPECIES: YcaO-like family protein [Sutcliffiella]|uniref:YcaO domain-containing protein n=1 Tax=Sutcliffiella cohnii TaxID=33932 RepID=A0A223KNH3_9BACI|nr:MULTISPECIES: YcaO-like family protein [Sutcliffiella]AST91031.1 hypothetical protein BC6307_06930 [Sutcliffiella cohnii]WBL16829.1 YcaO-like family protein [Sutcliffiella sp. NC1]